MLKIIISGLLLLSSSSMAAQLTIHQQGQSQIASVPDYARLADAYQHIQFDNNINWSGAFLTTPVLTSLAEKNKDKLITELNSLLATDIDHKNDLSALVQYLQKLPVAGRIPTRLDPDWVSTHVKFNRPLVGRYDLYITRYPGQISLIGLRQQKDIFPHDLAQVHDYLEFIQQSKLSDSGHAFLIEPDGTITKVGTGIWNRKQDLVVKPGSIIFVGLDLSELPDAYRNINAHILAVLANRIPE